MDLRQITANFQPEIAYRAQYNIVFVCSLSRARGRMSKVQNSFKLRRYLAKCLHFDIKVKTQRSGVTTLREDTILCVIRKETRIFPSGSRTNSAGRSCLRLLPVGKITATFSLKLKLSYTLNFVVCSSNASVRKTKNARTTNTTSALNADKMAVVFLLGPRLHIFALLLRSK